MAELFSVTALFFQGNKILSVSRKDDPNDLGLPGGKIDPGETPEQALVREVLEETGLRVMYVVPIFEDLDRVKNGELKPNLTYLITEWYDDVRTTETGVVRWVDPEELLSEACSFRDYNAKLLASLGVCK